MKLLYIIRRLKDNNPCSVIKKKGSQFNGSPLDKIELMIHIFRMQNAQHPIPLMVQDLLQSHQHVSEHVARFF